MEQQTKYGFMNFICLVGLSTPFLASYLCNVATVVICNTSDLMCHAINFSKIWNPGSKKCDTSGLIWNPLCDLMCHTPKNVSGASREQNHCQHQLKVAPIDATPWVTPIKTTFNGCWQCFWSREAPEKCLGPDFVCQKLFLGGHIGCHIFGTVRVNMLSRN